jgi:hypothetical protein
MEGLPQPRMNAVGMTQFHKLNEVAHHEVKLQVRDNL